MRSSRSSLKPMRCTSPFESRRSAPCRPAIGQIGHAEKRVDAVDAASRHDRDRAVGRASQRGQESRTGRHDDAVGRRGQLDERAVEIEEKSRLGGDRKPEVFASISAFQPELDRKSVRILPRIDRFCARNARPSDGRRHRDRSWLRIRTARPCSRLAKLAISSLPSQPMVRHATKCVIANRAEAPSDMDKWARFIEYQIAGLVHASSCPASNRVVAKCLLLVRVSSRKAALRPCSARAEFCSAQPVAAMLASRAEPWQVDRCQRPSSRPRLQAHRRTASPSPASRSRAARRSSTSAIRTARTCVRKRWRG